MAFDTGLFNTATNDLGGAVGELFQGFGDQSKAQGFRYKAQGEQFEKQNYLLASDLANQNEKFTEEATAIKQAQLDRQLTLSQGGTEAAVAGAGFERSGSSLDLLRESASQGALAKAVASQQGLITEAGYKEQAQSYQNLASAADVAIQADNQAASAEDRAGVGSFLGGAFKGAEGLFMGAKALALL